MFALARFLTRKGLRILCFHGISLCDEHRFNPGLFMRPEILRRRLILLKRRGFPVIALDKALQGLGDGKLPPCAVVLTFDDGFHSTYRVAVDLLHECSFPATVYVTSYYCGKGTPIFRLAVQYMFWKTTRRQVTLEGLATSGVVSVASAQARQSAMWDIIEHGETDLDDKARTELAQELGRRLGVEYDHLVQKRVLSLMSPDEISAIAERGIDVQLHTHHHRLPFDQSESECEIRDNRAVLEPLVRKRLEHLCYPSGVWSKDHWPWLEVAGIASATTCDPGLNYQNTPRLALRRFLDSERVAEIEFEAEISGYLEILRLMRSAAKKKIGVGTVLPSWGGGGTPMTSIPRSGRSAPVD